jgi:hypothetical protein
MSASIALVGDPNVGLPPCLGEMALRVRRRTRRPTTLGFVTDPHTR